MVEASLKAHAHGDRVQIEARIRDDGPADPARPHRLDGAGNAIQRRGPGTSAPAGPAAHPYRRRQCDQPRRGPGPVRNVRLHLRNRRGRPGSGRSRPVAAVRPDPDGHQDAAPGRRRRHARNPRPFGTRRPNPHHRPDRQRRSGRRQGLSGRRHGRRGRKAHQA
uniref:Beta-glucosidase n=1 Tax=Parastrongyloides trichosuri TaxID=131310 RepID=A0A0N4ZLG7_PARTI